MSLMRFEPTPTFPFFREMEEMSERLNRFLGVGPRRTLSNQLLTAADWLPAVDIQETETEYLIKAELPEVKKEDVTVGIENGVLYLSGDRKQEKEEKGKKFHRVERAYGSFLRSFTVPLDADETKVTAEFKDGILKLHLPKTEKAKSKVQQVKIT
jgi:HSP20 family protein